MAINKLVSIITPSYNQNCFLEQSVLSVISQDYDNLEYIVMDGGSTDGSVGTIKKYASQIAYWHSGPDGGQTSAIVSGFNRAKGEILGYVNSDDLLLPGAVRAVAEYFHKHPETDCVVGGVVVIDAGGKVVRNHFGLPRIVLGEVESLKTIVCRGGVSFSQVATFWRRDAYRRVGGLNPSLRFAMDFDLYLKLVQNAPFGHLDRLLGCLRLHSGSKTSTIQDVCASETGVLLKPFRPIANSPQGKLFKSFLYLRNILNNLPIRLKYRAFNDPFLIADKYNSVL